MVCFYAACSACIIKNLREGKQGVRLCFTFCDHIRSLVVLYVTGNDISAVDTELLQVLSTLRDFLSADAIKCEAS